MMKHEQRTKNGLQKSYVKPGNPIAPNSQTYINGLIRNAKERKAEKYLLAGVGDTVWCVFEDTPEGEINHGTIIRIEIDTNFATYTVLPDNSVDCEVFMNQDFGITIFTEKEI